MSVMGYIVDLKPSNFDETFVAKEILVHVSLTTRDLPF